MSKAIKNITGAEFKAFWGDDEAWGVDTFCEDLVFTIQGEEGLDMETTYSKYGDSFENLPDTAILTLEGGYRLQGGLHPSREAEDLLTIFRDWKMNRDMVTFSTSMNVPKADPETLEKVSRLVGELKALGATVIRSDDPEEQPKPVKPKH